VRIWSYIWILVILQVSFTPCHGAEHEHGSGKCSHHHTTKHHHDHDKKDKQEQNEEDHPCSPFCAYHGAFFIENNLVELHAKLNTTEENEPIYGYLFPIFNLRDNSFWHPPKK